MPRPRPISRQDFRSVAVACARRGNRASGTERLRPSLKSTVNVFVTVTDSAEGMSVLLVMGNSQIQVVLGISLLSLGMVGT